MGLRSLLPAVQRRELPLHRPRVQLPEVRPPRRGLPQVPVAALLLQTPQVQQNLTKWILWSYTLYLSLPLSRVEFSLWGCSRFNGASFLEKWRGKKIMFVGDSLSLNMWQSLSCMIHSSVPNARTSLIRRDGLASLTFLVSFIDPRTQSHKSLIDRCYSMIFRFLSRLNRHFLMSPWIEKPSGSKLSLALKFLLGYNINLS